MLSRLSTVHTDISESLFPENFDAFFLKEPVVFSDTDLWVVSVVLQSWHPGCFFLLCMDFQDIALIIGHSLYAFHDS